MRQLEDTSTQVHDWVKQTFPLAKGRDIGPHDSLLDSGIIDSLGTLEVVTFLESAFGIVVTDEEMVADHFESIHAIAQFVEQKTAA